MTKPTDPADAVADEGSADSSQPEDSAGSTSAAQKSYATILQQQIQEGVDELERPPGGLLLSAFSAGLDIGFSVLAIALVGTLAIDQAPDLTTALLRANAYAVGFVLVIFGRSELYTEHTTLAVLPLLDGRTTASRLGRLWGLVLLGNLAGVAVFSAILAITGPALGTVEPRVLTDLASHLLEHDTRVMALSAVLAGWLMGLVSWLVTAGRDTVSQIFFVWLVTSLIGLAELHHCVLGSAELLSAAFMGAPVSPTAAARFLVVTTVGNTVGGCIFVAVVKYGHASILRPGMRDPRSQRYADES